MPSLPPHRNFMFFYDNTLPTFSLAPELQSESAPPPLQRDRSMGPAIEAVARAVDGNPATMKRNQKSTQLEPPYLHRQQIQAPVAQPTTNPPEDDPNEDPATTDSDTEVRFVMEGMKSWTKTPPFPNDVEYLFPKETRRRRMEAQRQFQLRELGREVLMGGRGRDMIERATGRPALEGLLLPLDLGVWGEHESGRI
jgi:hypothetical protein